MDYDYRVFESVDGRSFVLYDDYADLSCDFSVFKAQAEADISAYMGRCDRFYDMLCDLLFGVGSERELFSQLEPAAQAVAFCRLIREADKKLSHD